MEDLTPQFDVPIASQEVTLPSQPIDTGGSTGGFMTSPNGLTSGQLSLNSAGETILVGSATAAMTGVGVFIGNAGDGTYDFRAGDPSGNYIHWDASAATLTITGSISVTAGGTIGGFNVGTDYIRDVANSFGLASTVTGGDDVRFWAGDTYANRNTAPFTVTEGGAVTARSITVGGSTYQYEMNDSGINTFGDGSDGTIDLNGSTDYNSFSSHSGANYTLTRNVYAVSITIEANIFLYTAGFRIYAINNIHLTNTGSIFNEGGNASGSTGGTGAPSGYLSGGANGGNGGSGGGGGAGVFGGVNGGNGTSASVPSSLANCIGTLFSSTSPGGGDGGNASFNTGGTHGNGAISAVNTIYNIKPSIYFHITTMLDINNDASFHKYTSSVAASGGGGGGGGANDLGYNGASGFGGSGGNGGGGGGSGGIIWIAARTITLDSGTISVKGGNGGNGGNGNPGVVSATNPTVEQAGGGGGAGGVGGSGGVIFLIYNKLTNGGTLNISRGTGGTLGTGGTGVMGGGNGTDGLSNGADGINGQLIQIMMAL